MTSGPALQQKVIAIVADALARDPAEVQPHSSLIDDLGAESIDFIDLAFRIESAFSIKIPGDEMWRGAVRTGDPAEMRQAVDRLRAEMPEFRWDRYRSPIRAEDLPRLITVRTIVDYLVTRNVALDGPGDAP